MSYQSSWVPFSAFISHKTMQVELLVAVFQTLRSTGVNVHVAEWNYQAGRPLYDGKIAELLRGSDCVVAILTHEASVSPDIQQELGATWAQGKPIVALVEEGLRPPGLLAGKEVVYFTRNSLDGKLDELRQHVAYWRQQKQNTWMKRGVIGGLVALGLAVSSQFGSEKPSNDDKFFTISQAAQYSGYSESSIRRWIREGSLKYWEDDNGTRYVTKRRLDAFLISTGRA